MNRKKTDDRQRAIVRTSIIGIVSNLVLAGFKAAVGLLSNSIAIVLDAVNNTSDALSSTITVIGAKLAGRPADKQHPYGHGRYEYLSAAVIAVLILYAGITALIESVKSIFDPKTPEYSWVTFVVVGSAIAVKIALGLYFRAVGNRYDSDALSNSGTDALQDAVISASTAVAAGVYMIWGVSLEAYLGVIISGFIIKAGVEMIRETISKILGERPDRELSLAVKDTICETEGVLGAYDLVMNSYGPGRWLASVHISVPDSWNADKIDTVTREITDRVAEKNKVFLTAVGIYSHNTANDEIKKIRSEITELVVSEEFVIQIHGFYCDTEKRKIRFDVVLDFKAPDKQALLEKLYKRIELIYPDYDVLIQPDTDSSD